MAYFTVLWITILSGPIEGTVSGLVFKSLADCEAHRSAVFDMMKDQHDIMLDCDESDLASGSIRPKRRPGA